MYLSSLISAPCRADHRVPSILATATATATVAIAATIMCSVSAPAAAQSSLPPQLFDVSPEIRAALEDPFAPLGEVDPQRYLPSPSPDPWYNNPPPVDESIAPGTILASREVDIPWFNAANTERSWQMLIRTADSHDKPISTISTVIIPQAPWREPGPRPILSFALAIDALGMECQPSWAMRHGLDLQFPPILQLLVARGYGVVVTDYLGPRAAYGAGRMNGHALLDGVRAARAFEPAGLTESKAAIFGYSGGGIGAGAAAQMQAAYAPEMKEYLAGIAVGGSPKDLDESFDHIDGTVGSGLLRGAIFGIAREYPELYQVFNRAGGQAAVLLKDSCAAANTLSGAITAPIALLAATPDFRNDPRVKHVFKQTRLGTQNNRPGEIPAVPIAIFSADETQRIGPFPGLGDQFFPEENSKSLRQEWCAAGANVDYIPLPGEHIAGMFTSPAPVLHWLDERLLGRSVDGCATPLP